MPSSGNTGWRGWGARWWGGKAVAPAPGGIMGCLCRIMPSRCCSANMRRLAAKRGSPWLRRWCDSGLIMRGSGGKPGPDPGRRSGEEEEEGEWGADWWPPEGMRCVGNPAMLMLGWCGLAGNSMAPEEWGEWRP